MIAVMHPCPKCELYRKPADILVISLRGEPGVCRWCGHSWIARPSAVDLIWFRSKTVEISQINPLPIYLALEKWAARGWAEAAHAGDLHMRDAWSNSLCDFISLRRSGRPARHSYYEGVLAAPGLAKTESLL